MESVIRINHTTIIPLHEIEITASRSGGAGGQHVNKTSTKITIRWNVRNSVALTDEQKERVIAKLGSRLTAEGDFIINSSESRSQQKNKELALRRLAESIRKALYVPKKRIATTVSQGAKAKRLHTKTRRSDVKKLRRVRYDQE